VSARPNAWTAVDQGPIPDPWRGLADVVRAELARREKERARLLAGLSADALVLLYVLAERGAIAGSNSPDPGAATRLLEEFEIDIRRALAEVLERELVTVTWLAAPDEWPPVPRVEIRKGLTLPPLEG